MEITAKDNKGKTHTEQEEAILQKMLGRKTSTPRFNINASIEYIESLIRSSYTFQVMNRRKKFIPTEETLKHIHDVASYVSKEQDSFGIILLGNCGNGKSTMMLALQAAINFLRDTNFFTEGDVAFEGLRILDARKITTLKGSEFDRIKAVPMLGIDDLGTEPTEVMEYGNISSPITELLEYRYSLQLFTMISTNLPPADIRKKYGNRVADRMNEMFHRVSFTQKTFRHD